MSGRQIYVDIDLNHATICRFARALPPPEPDQLHPVRLVQPPGVAGGSDPGHQQTVPLPRPLLPGPQPLPRGDQSVKQSVELRM